MSEVTYLRKMIAGFISVVGTLMSFLDEISYILNMNVHRSCFKALEINGHELEVVFVLYTLTSVI